MVARASARSCITVGQKSSFVKAVIPAAGAGSRLRPLTDDRPKGLVSVAGEPLLFHVFDTAIDAGVTEIVVVIGQRGKQIRDRFGDAFDGVPLTYVRQPQPRGLGDAVQWATDQVDGPFLLLNGDNVFVDSIRPVVEQAADPAVDAVVLVEDAGKKDPTETSVVSIHDGEVCTIIEKPSDSSSRTIGAGCYVLPPVIGKALALTRPSERGEIELPDAIDLLISAGYTVVSVHYEGERINVNTPADIDDAEALLHA